jgi:hypothetical protein
MEIVPSEINVIDFGAVQVNDKAMKVITISNTGKFPFDFKWDYQRHPNVSLSPGNFFIFFFYFFFFSLFSFFMFFLLFVILSSYYIIG